MTKCNTIIIRIDKEMDEFLQEIAFKYDCSKSKIIRILIENSMLSTKKSLKENK